jgi:aspartyl-tRNA synthetase
MFAKFFKSLPLESLLDVRGVLVEANVSSCTQSTVELQMDRAYVVSESQATLPFLLADAQRGEKEIEASQETDRPYVRVLPELRLDNRWLDLRVPANNGIMRVQSAVCRIFRSTLTAKGFIEIHSPKLIAGESEGGAEVFRTDYFGRQASLAQSPQLYKQMAMSADLPGVFEVGPVFRAENSNTNRHLCEFTGLDLEMPIDWHYDEVIAVIHETLVSICDGVESECADVLAVIRKMYPSEAPRIPKDSPCVVHWPEAMEMLAGAGFERDPMHDLSTEEERTLGRLVLEKYGSDLFFLDRYPSSVRPFYTMPCRDQPEYSNSYDVIFRGQEIGSGAQRCHDPELLEARCRELEVPMEPLQPYIDSFRHGVPPHGGVGLGLERIVQLHLGLDNIRKAALFVRDPVRLSP